MVDCSGLRGTVSWLKLFGHFLVITDTRIIRSVTRVFLPRGSSCSPTHWPGPGPDLRKQPGGRPAPLTHCDSQSIHVLTTSVSLSVSSATGAWARHNTLCKFTSPHVPIVGGLMFPTLSVTTNSSVQTAETKTELPNRCLSVSSVTDT